MRAPLTWLRKSGLSESKPQMIRKLVLSIFILAHLVVLPVSLLPSSQWRDQLLVPFYPYIYFWGLDQNWTVFAPAPPQWNAFMSAIITFDDGSTEAWEFPQMHKMGFVEKMFNERFRKWANDYVGDFRQAIIWPDTVRYIARIHARQNRQPVSVSIVRRAVPITLSGNSTVSEEGSQVIYTQDVVPEDLR